MPSDEEKKAWRERFTLICKPEQSGKTFIMIKKINEEIHLSPHGVRVVNLIFCDNNLLLTKQTSNRLNEPKKDNGKGGLHKEFIIPDTQEKYIEFSSRKDGKAIGNVAEVWMKIHEGIRNIVCCTNSQRVRDIKTLIRKMNTSSLKPQEKLVFKIWLDEADKFTTYIRNRFLTLVKDHQNVHCFCLTATPEPLFQLEQFDSMNVEPFMISTFPDYHGWKDNNLVPLPNHNGKTLAFVKQAIKHHSSYNGSPAVGTKWFVPADHTKRSHRDVCDLLVSHGFAVFIVNGDGIELVLPGSPKVNKGPFPKTDELNKQLIQLYQEYSLQQYPLAITGNICIGRGISIMSKTFMFDFGILSSCKDPTTASQAAGRLKGNIKRWASYKPPVVYTTPQFDRVVTEQENLSRRLAGLAFEQDEDKPSSITAKKAGIVRRRKSKPSLGKVRYATSEKWVGKKGDEEAIKWVSSQFKQNRDKDCKEPKKMRPCKQTPQKQFSEKEYREKLQKKSRAGLGNKMGSKGDICWIKKVRLDDEQMMVFWNSSDGDEHKFHAPPKNPDVMVHEFDPETNEWSEC